jgi:hypothetical protein
VTLFGMSLAFRQAEGCPPHLQWGPASFEPRGAPTAAPSFDEAGEPVPLGSTLIGLSSRAVFGPPGSRPADDAGARPDQIALDCGDGTFQTYAVTRVLSPGGALAAPE